MDYTLVCFREGREGDALEGKWTRPGNRTVRGNVSDNGVTLELHMTAVQMVDGGEYVCSFIAANGGEWCRATANLTVVGKEARTRMQTHANLHELFAPQLYLCIYCMKFDIIIKVCRYTCHYNL